MSVRMTFVPALAPKVRLAALLPLLRSETTVTAPPKTRSWPAAAKYVRALSADVRTVP